MHNALADITIEAAGLKVTGFSISALATWLIIPELDVCFDMGECPLSAVPMNHVLLTHAHGDHSRCLQRHDALRRLGALPRAAAYYVPSETVDGLRAVMRAEAMLVGVTEATMEYPDFRGMLPGDGPIPLAHRRDLAVTAFNADHSIPSRGYTISRLKKRLRPEFVGTPGPELGRLRREGVVFEDPVHDPVVTFIGDCTGATLTDESHIWDSRLLIVECTYILPGEQHLADRAKHTHLDELIAILETRAPGPELIIKHFSMRYSPAVVRKTVLPRIPAAWRDRTHLLI
ncbi:MAG: ribonuclease Z [Myxococcota bacterium]|jgi:ribonuclease Z